MAYAKLSVDDLNKSIAQTKEAIQRGNDLLKVVSEQTAIKGLPEAAESLPVLMKKFEKELKNLEKALEKKTAAT